MIDALVAAIEANPDDVESFRVLADVLQSAGDPRGALIAMQISRETEPMPLKARILAERIDEHFMVHDGTLLGSLRPWAKTWTWRYGFLHSVELRVHGNDPTHVRDVLRAVLAHPSARFVRELALTIRYHSQQVIDDLIAAAPKSLRTLALWIEDGPVDLAALWPRIRHVTKLSLSVYGEHTLGVDEMPSIREAALYRAATKAALERWPALERLHLNVTMSDQQDDVMAILDNPHLPRVTSLHVSGSHYTNDLVARLSSTVVGKQLDEIDLDFGALDDDGVSRWLAAPPARPFRVLSVVGNRVSKAARASLTAIADRVIGRQKER